MATLLDLVQEVADKNGISKEEIKDFITTNSNLASIDVPGVVVQGLSNLVTVERAKTHEEVIEYFNKKVKAEALNGVDKVVLGKLSLLPEDQQDAVKAEKNSYKQVEMLADFLAEARKEARKDGDKDAVKALNDEIANLQKALKDKDLTYAEQLQVEQQKFNNILRGQALEKDLAGVKLHPLLANSPTKVQFYDAEFDAKLKEKYPKGERRFDPATGFKLVNKETGGPLYDDKHVEVGYNSFRDHVLSAYVSTDPAPANNPDAAPRTVTGTNTKDGQQIRTLASMQEEIV